MAERRGWSDFYFGQYLLTALYTAMTESKIAGQTRLVLTVMFISWSELFDCTMRLLNRVKNSWPNDVVFDFHVGKYLLTELYVRMLESKIAGSTRL